jgi:hypothetical protein
MLPILGYAHSKVNLSVRNFFAFLKMLLDSSCPWANLMLTGMRSINPAFA